MFEEEVFRRTLWVQSSQQLLPDQEREVGGGGGDGDYGDEGWQIKLSCFQRESLEVQTGGCPGGVGEGQRGEGQGGEGGEGGYQAGEDQHQETRQETAISVRVYLVPIVMALHILPEIPPTKNNIPL